jgi:hypothetical protein
MGMKLSAGLEQRCLAIADEPVARRQWHHHCEAGLVIGEKEFMAQVVAYAEANHWLVYHTYNSQRCQAGFPDLVLLRPPQLLFAELKTDAGQVTPEQQMWMDCLLAVPGIGVHLWRPADLGQIEEALR